MGVLDMYAILIMCVVGGLILATPVIRIKRAFQEAHATARRGL